MVGSVTSVLFDSAKSALPTIILGNNSTIFLKTMDEESLVA